MNRGIVLAVLALAPCLAAQPYQVGHLTRNFTDASRGGRAVQTEVYYPADVGGTSVPLAAGTALFPVVAVGHGFVMPADRYEYLWDFLVARGYLVALPRTEGGIVPSHLEFGRDLAFVISELQAEGMAGGSMFFARVDATSCVLGHSMGGGASFLAAELNPGITALASFAAAETNPSAVTASGSILQPTLIFSGADDCVAPPASHQILMYDALVTACKARVEITGGSHCQFAEDDANCNLGEFFSGCSAAITRSQQQGLVTQLLGPWLDAQLKGDAAAQAAYDALLAAPTGFTVTQDCVAPPPSGTCGDCNQDGAVDILDALAAAQHAVGLALLIGQGFANCDVDALGTVTILDALTLAQAVAGLPVILMCP